MPLAIDACAVFASACHVIVSSRVESFFHFTGKTTFDQLGDRIALRGTRLLVPRDLDPLHRHAGAGLVVPLAAEVEVDPHDLIREVDVSVVADLAELVDIVGLAHVLVGGRSEVAGAEERARAAFDRVHGDVQVFAFAVAAFAARVSRRRRWRSR
jgi:hypothetical protein